ncbi:MAG: hypothetical protein ACOYL6_18795 [Bacteriovoracaceae bacterium]
MIIRRLFFLFIAFYTSHSLALDCPPNKYPVKAHPRTDYYRNDGTYVSGSNVSETCREFRTLKPLKVHFEEKVPKGWPHKKEKFRVWTVREKSKVSKALDQLPAMLNQTGKLEIYRAIKSEINDNPATTAPDSKIITLYDDISKHELKRVLAHELAHIYYVAMSDTEREAYYKASRWNFKRETGAFYTDRNSFTAED